MERRAMTAASVLVYRQEFLPLSETFISDHVRALQRYEPIVVCEQDMPAQHRADIPACVITRGRIKRGLLSRLGISPALSRLVSAKKPIHIHAHFLFDAARILRFARRANLPLVVTAHGYDATLNETDLRKTPGGEMLIARSAE